MLSAKTNSVTKKFSSYLKIFLCLNPLKTKYPIGNKTFHSLQIKIKMKLQDVFLSGICEQVRVWGTEKL